jgi:hypothetical protein
VNSDNMKARLTHLAVLAALGASSVFGAMGWLGFSDGAW